MIMSQSASTWDVLDRVVYSTSKSMKKMHLRIIKSLTV